MRGRFGGFDESSLIEFEQKYNYAAGTGQPCGASHISAAYTCRVGLSDASSAEEVGAALMGSSFEDYQRDYASFREKELDKSCKQISDRCFGKDNDSYPSAAKRAELDTNDQVRLLASKRALALMEEVKEYDSLGTQAGADAGTKMLASKEFFDDVKWNMQPEALLVTTGTLDMAWDGVALNKNYAAQFPNDKSAKFGQSRAGVNEHPYPTHALKDGLREMQPTNARQIMDFALRRNFISITSAPEDESFTGLGLKSVVPNKSDIMSRYTTAKVKTFILDERVSSSNSSDYSTGIMKSAKNAKARGISKEEWIGSIVRSPGRPPAKDVFMTTKPKAAKAKPAKPKAAKAKPSAPTKPVGMANWSKSRLQAALDRAYNSGDDAKIAQIRGILGGMS